VGDVISLDHPGVKTAIDPETGETVIQISADDFNVYLTNPNGSGSNNFEAFALVDDAAGETLDFYDIGGGTKNIQAQDGPAAGEVSENIPMPSDQGSSKFSIQFNKEDGGEVSYKEISEGDSGFVCFCADTEIATPDGTACVQSLQVGDLVTTKDQGPQPILWIGQQTVVARGSHAPVRFAPTKGAAPLAVSQQHRMLVDDPRLELTHGAPEALVAARHMVDGSGVRLVPAPRVTYVHIALAGHHLLLANGRWCESLFLGQQSLSRLPPEMRVNVLAATSARHHETARTVISGREWTALRQPAQPAMA
ncbi:MAG: Hint domain-containing protein, partial [Pseudomonadota bacterium]